VFLLPAVSAQSETVVDLPDSPELQGLDLDGPVSTQSH
jgi:hypothetical protein